MAFTIMPIPIALLFYHFFMNFLTTAQGYTAYKTIEQAQGQKNSEASPSKRKKKWIAWQIYNQSN